MYKLITLATLFAGLAAAQSTATLSYNTLYDNPNLSLNDVACSNGPNGLESKSLNYTTLGSLPTFPNLGGVFTVTNWNSPACGSCYAVTYKGVSLNILAVDTFEPGFSVSEEAMNTLTGNLAAELGSVTVTYTEIPSTSCGIPAN